MLPAAATIGKYLAIIGAAGLVLTRAKPAGIVRKIFSGIASLYDISGYRSDFVLFPSFGFGLATGVVALTINAMAELLSGARSAILSWFCF